MDYEFFQDLTGVISAKFSMDHEAIGYWLNEEVKGDLSIIEQINNAFSEIKGSNKQWQKIGHEYTLLMDDEEIMIRANQLVFETDDLEEGMSYYDNESVAFCGIEDFQLMLSDYSQFVLANTGSFAYVK
ncbi:YacL family protein [Moellerella wisconsensis]|uniref:UPF0231 protein MNY72_10970 n=2 Tax=Moellerella wisconsensis TaxID=158849 RepID=A0A9Q8PZW5_9GAMM|nr:YacL family protein [Moellerella wisconsensis]KLN97608.1 hypothetical protein VK86_03965 [Moellerella wisconsensis]UNH23379.1 YacL family protein [Moellerella wisconsensis]UNH26458.1 YacL family protein [Moellerella wisconsensis]UNH29875.1 YacL family protein [Moellerella wisconsensis]UNH38100.1 YacL family protein [Moellerella wisconsensis]